jgi:ligand-binding SRPBCC domain-containing protein
MYISDFSSRQIVKAPLDQVFAFFSDAGNLGRLTPPWLKFEILTPRPIEMAAGALIDYRLRWHGIPMRWRTEIEVWEPGVRFVDRQIRGPYRLWRHEHLFEQHRGGTLVEDKIAYAAIGGRLAHSLVVNRDVETIFNYRREALEAIFPS